MPCKKTTPAAKPDAILPAELLEKLIPGPMDAASVEAVFQKLKKAVIERALSAELGVHLASPEGGRGNHRNGRSGKTVLTDAGPLRIDVPRDRAGSFEPQLIPKHERRFVGFDDPKLEPILVPNAKHERRFVGFDDRIISMYARGMSVREIQGHLAEMYAVEVWPEFISAVTDAVMAEVGAWQSRPLEPMYPVVFFDALRVKIREDGVVRKEPRAFPERRGRHQADLAGPVRYHRRGETGEQGMEISDEPVRDTVRRPLHPRAALSRTRKDSENRLTHKNSDSPLRQQLARLILARQPRRPTLQRPFDTQGRVVPADAALVFGAVVVGGFVEEVGLFAKRQKAVRKTRRYPQQALVVFAEFDAHPLAVGGRLGPNVHRHVEYCSAHHAHQLTLRLGR